MPAGWIYNYISVEPVDLNGREILTNDKMGLVGML